MIEYIDQQINHLAWQLSGKTADITGAGNFGEHLISGSKDCVSIWQFLDSPESNIYDKLPIAEVACEKTSASVCKVQLIGHVAFSTLIDGTVQLHELVTEPNNRKFLKLISSTSKLHGAYRCNDMLFCAQTNSVITCGNDGALSSFNIDHPQKFTSKQVSQSSLKCMDLVTPNEVICGTLNGCLKHYDLRSYDCIGSYANQTLSTLMCLQRNPNVNHLATGGNDEGSIIIFDLRNPNAALAQISAHSGAITHVRYRPRDSYVLYSSSCDGELFRWNLHAEFGFTQANHIPKKVESIGCTSDPMSITSFDVNHLGDLVYTADHGALFYHKLKEFGI